MSSSPARIAVLRADQVVAHVVACREISNVPPNNNEVHHIILKLYPRHNNLQQTKGAVALTAKQQPQ
jgi:hypothetical protein